MGVITACAPTAEPASIPTPDPAESIQPSPTPTVPIIPGGEAPPTVFAGDCASAVSTAQLIAATGVDGIEVARRDQRWTRSIDNVGGLVCEWQGGGVTGNVTILPKSGLEGARLPGDVSDAYFGLCGWDCAWQWESPELWVMGYSSDLADRGRDEADRIGAQIGAGIASRTAVAGLGWQRDREQWWPTAECADLAAELASHIGADVTGEAAGYHDSPSPATALADIASHRTWCGFSSAGQQIALAVFESGAAWDLPWADLGEPVDLGVPGVRAFSSTQGGYLGGAVYEATDGVNAMNVEIAPDSGWGQQELAAVFAAAFVAP
ncbi:hypothetical protein ACFVSU_15885 [Microbacterium sp. NPDC058062]|uniref:hypothetical protein n=1 Tax=Microbacterium sp. NPDC058062 TaxID=3346320 RepID=UPI0036DB70F4